MLKNPVGAGLFDRGWHRGAATNLLSQVASGRVVNSLPSFVACFVKTTPQMTRFRDVKVCNNLATEKN